MADLASLFMGNVPHVVPKQFNTPLQPLDELSFRQWVQDENVPFDPQAGVTDYDMRGFWQALQQQQPNATASVNQNDGQMHYPDLWKTPLHQTFSTDSQWSTPAAPSWNNQDQLVSPNGRVVYDERAQTLANMFGGSK